MKTYTLAKAPSGEILMFSVEEGLGYGAGGKRQILLEEAADDFDIGVDENQCIQIVCQDLSGRIQLISLENGAWKRRVLLESKSREVYDKKLTLYRVSTSYNLFYVLRHDGKQMLVHHILGREPEAVDYFEQDTTALCVFEEQKLFAFYRDTKTHLLCYRRYDWSQKRWEEKRSLELPDVVSVWASCRKDQFYLCYRQKNKLYFQKYETFDGVSLVPCGLRILLTEDRRIHQVVLLHSEKQFYVLWEGENGPCVVSSADGAKTFDAPRKLPYARQTALYRLRAFGQLPLREETYGYVLGGKLNLLAHDRFLTPDVSKRDVRYVSKTREIERFSGIAQENPLTEERKPDAKIPPDLDIAFHKLRIRVEQLERGVQELRRRLDASDTQVQQALRELLEVGQKEENPRSSQEKETILTEEKKESEEKQLSLKGNAARWAQEIRHWKEEGVRIGQEVCLPEEEPVQEAAGQMDGAEENGGDFTDENGRAEERKDAQILEQPPGAPDGQPPDWRETSGHPSEEKAQPEG